MLHKKFVLRLSVIGLLALNLFVLAAAKAVQAAPEKDPARLQVLSDTPTDTPTDTLTATPTATPSYTLSPTNTPTITETPSITLTPSTTLTPSITLSPTLTLTFTRTPTFTNTPTITGTLPTATPTAPAHIVISEFRTQGPLGADDEFVELYNPTGAAVNIGGWQINKSSGCGTGIQTLVVIKAGAILQAGQHYLVASAGNSLPTTNPPDQTFSLNIADNGGIALVSASTVIDQVGMCDATFYHEGRVLTPLPIAPPAPTPTPLPGTYDQSYERKPGGNTSCYDTNDNASDFKLLSPANPQNQDSGIVLCSGVVLFTPTYTPTPTMTATRTLTRTRTPTRTFTAIPGGVVLNEFLPHPQTDWNGDGTANVGDEYIEIINVSSSPLSVLGWKLDTGLNSVRTFTLPEMLLQPRQIATFFGSQTGLSLRDGGGTVRLLRSDGRIIDAFTYPAVEIADLTWCRIPDGNGAWGFVCRPSPDQPNSSMRSTTPDLSAPGGGSICSQSNTFPQSLVLAECNSYGAGISNNPPDGLIWLQRRWKWDVFLE